MRQWAAIILVATMLIGCAPTPPPPPTQGPISSGPPVRLVLGARVEISPSAVLLTAVGGTRKLSAQAFDAAGNPSSGTATWSSSDPTTVEVAADGTLTARALGSAQITATIDGVSSAPVLALVTTPAAGVTLVADDQITAGPVATDPSAEPSLNNTYKVTLAGVPAKVGDLLIGTGEKALAGKVVSVDGSTLTMSLVPLPDLLPDLRIEQTIDLANAQIDAPANIVRLYDITRTGNTFDFTPKPDFMQLVAQLPRPARPNRLTASLGGVAAATGTYMLPFEECETELGAGLPIELSDPPTFTMTINPSLDIVWTPDNDLVHWLVRAQPKATLKVGLKINAEFEAEISCSATFFEYLIPIAGILSWFVSGKVPVGLGFELGGKVVAAGATVGGKVDASAKAALGLDCSVGTSCSLVDTLDTFKVEPTLSFVAPTISDVRLQPSFEVNGFVKAAIGNPFLQTLTLDFATAKVGGKASADWSPRVGQMTDTTYQSEYKLSLEAGVSIGTKLSEIAEKFGQGEIDAVALDISTDLYHSPTAKLTTDKVTYAAGETIVAKVHFDPPENLKILDLFYNVDRVLLVHYSGADAVTVGTETVLGTATATDGQSDFEFNVPAPAAVNGKDLYAFVVPKYFSPSDELALELERGGGSRIAFASDRDGTVAMYTMNPDGSDPTKEAVIPGVPAIWNLWGLSVSNDRNTMAWCAQGLASGGGLRVMDRATGNVRTVREGCFNEHYAISRDFTRIVIAMTPPGTNEGWHLFVTSIDGSGETQITPGGNETSEYFPIWSADGSKVAFYHASSDDAPSKLGIFAMPSGGGSMTPIVLMYSDVSGGKAWSPDGSQLAYRDRAPQGGVGIWVADVNGGNARFLKGGGEDPGGFYPTWSPDGTQIAFMNANDIWIMDAADGTNLVNLTNSAAVETFPVFITP